MQLHEPEFTGPYRGYEIYRKPPSPDPPFIAYEKYGIDVVARSWTLADVMGQLDVLAYARDRRMEDQNESTTSPTAR